jgi:hypothetical protein
MEHQLPANLPIDEMHVSHFFGLFPIDQHDRSGWRRIE